MDEMRLQRFLARAGVASRRHGEALIAAGRVTVNGAVAELGAKVDPLADVVAVDGAVVEAPGEAVTLMLHKPAGYVTTMDDPQGRPTVAELVPAVPGLYPIGRLDAPTTGLLLFSTDGELGQGLLHPRTHVRKRYLALVEGRLSGPAAGGGGGGGLLAGGGRARAGGGGGRGAAAEAAARAIGGGHAAGVEGPRQPKGRFRARGAGAGTYVAVGLYEGRKRQVRRMLEAVGHPVRALHRASIAGLELGDLPRGQWRELSPEDLAKLSAEG